MRSRTLPSSAKLRQQRTEPFSFRLTPIAAIFAGLGLIMAGPLQAAGEKSITELEAEAASLKQAYDKVQQELAAKKTGAVPGNATTTSTVPAASSGPAASSTQGLEAVVISGRRAASPLEALKDTPKSVSVVSGEELEKLNAVNVKEIFSRIGNVQWNYGNPKTGSMSIRGVSSGSSENIDPSLGVTVDNVPYAYVALASGSDYVDLESVDVSRGPQGFDGGRATSMGTINIKTRRPTFTPEANASVTFGENNTLQTQGALGGAVIDDVLAWRGTFYRNQAETPFNNAYKDIEDRGMYGNTDRSYGRAQFLLTPSSNFEGLFSVDFKPKGIEFVNGLSVRNAYPTPYYANGTNYEEVAKNSVQTKLNRKYFTAANSYSYGDYLRQPVNEDQNKGILNGNKGASANLTWKGEGNSLMSTTAWRSNFFQASNDEGTPFDITKNGGLYVNYEQYSQEFKLLSNPGGQFDYVTGLYLGQTRSEASSRSRYGSDSGAWFATEAQYQILDPLVSSALSPSGRELLKDSTDRLRKQTLTLTDNKTQAVYAKGDWHLDELTGLPLTFGSGVRFTREDRRTRQGNQVTDEGFGVLLNAGNQGGFNSNATTGALATNTAAQLAMADQVAQKYFGAANYAALSAAQRTQVANAKAVRAAQRTTVSDVVEATPFEDILPTGMLSLSYKFNEGLTTYGTYQHGAKPGISQVVSTTNAAANVKGETTNAFELGFRSLSLNKTLVVNADVFLQYLDNFQTAISVYDPIQAVATPANPYISLTGNVPQVKVQGLELDAAYSGLQNTTLRFAGAYNDATYNKSVFLTGPEENGYLSANVIDAKGRTLPNAPKYSFNLSGDYRASLNDSQDFHIDANYHWQSRSNSTVGESKYSWVDAYGVVDLGFGVGRKDRTFDLTFLVKNALNDDYRTSSTATSYVPATPRWFGIVFSGKI